MDEDSFLGCSLRWRTVSSHHPITTLLPCSRHTAVKCGPGNTVAIFGGIRGSDWSSDVNLLTLTNSNDGSEQLQWCAPSKVSGQAPACRRDHAGCGLAENAMLIFGGFDGKQELSDLHVCTIHAGEPGTASTVSWETLQSRNPSPEGRSHAAIAWDASSQNAYVFGGYNSKAGCRCELWVFNLEHREWWQPTYTGSLPPPRRSHACVVVGGCLWVFGGYDGRIHYNDLYCLNLKEWHWTSVVSSGQVPSPRRCFASSLVDSRHWLISGGYDGEGYLRDTCVLDPVTCMWTALPSLDSDMPVARGMHSLTPIGSGMLVIGGVGSAGPVSALTLLENKTLSEATRLRRRLEQVEAELAASKAELAASRAEAEAERRRVSDAHKAECAALLAESEARRQRAEHAESACSEARREAESTSAAARQSLESLQVATDKLARDRAALRRLEAEHERLKVEAEGAVSKASRHREAGLKAVAAAEELRERAQASEQLAASLQAQLDEARARGHAVLLQVEGAASQMESQVADSDRLASELRSVKVQLAASREAAKAGRKQIEAAVQAALVPANAQQARMQADMDALRGQLEESNASCAAAQSRCAELEGRLQAMAKRVSSAASSALTIEVDELLTAVEDARVAGVLAGMRGAGSKQMLKALAEALCQAGEAEAQNTALRLELKSLQGKCCKLEDEASRMRSATERAEYMRKEALGQLRAVEANADKEVERLAELLRQAKLQSWDADIRAQPEPSAPPPRGRADLPPSASQSSPSKAKPQPGPVPVPSEPSGCVSAGLREEQTQAQAQGNIGAHGDSRRVADWDTAFAAATEDLLEVDLLPEVGKLMELHHSLLSAAT